MRLHILKLLKIWSDLVWYLLIWYAICDDWWLVVILACGRLALQFSEWLQRWINQIKNDI